MSWRLITASLVASAAYASTFAFGAFQGSWAVKASSVALLAALARRHRLLAAGLLCGAAGDALLDLDPKYFLAGLSAFLVGHVLYALCFWRHGRRAAGPAAQAALLLAAAAFVAWLWPALGPMRAPAACYFAALMTMVLASLRVGGWVSAGALLFLASDALLATDRFRVGVPLRDGLVWSSYYGAQLAIALGYLRSPSATVGVTRARRADPDPESPSAR